jgi:hypothetical protein
MIYQLAYDATGKIRFSACCSELMDLTTISPELTVIETEGEVDPVASYVSAGQVTARPSFGQFDKLTLTTGQEATLTGLPNPTSVTVNGQVETVTDGELILPWAGAGNFNVLVHAWPYFDYSAVIECA